MAEIQREKSGLLYDYIESSDFYTNPVKDAKDRSVCNIPFVTPSKDLDAKFVAEADALGFKISRDTVQWVVCVPVFITPSRVKVCLI